MRIAIVLPCFIQKFLKMKSLLSFITFVFLTQTLLAQDISYKISGVIKDPEKNSVMGATILLTVAGDTIVQKAAISDGNGKFSLQVVKPGSYQFLVTMVGYERFLSQPVTLDTLHTNIRLPNIQLRRADAKVLKGVVVTARKPLIEQQLDKLVVNVDVMLSSASSNALELLARAPGVMVAGNGSISFNGKDGVLVLINGRPTYLSGNDLTNYLKSLPGGTIEKIELMSNPPAKYEASGNAGVINIRIKKNTIKGFNGNLSLSYTQAAYWRSNDAVNFSYRNYKVNLFGNLSYSGNRDYVRTDISRRYLNPDKSLSSGVQMNIFNKNVSDGVNFRAGMDYFATSKTIVGFVVNALTRPSSEKKYTNSILYDNTETVDSTVYGFLDGKYTWKNVGINLNLQHRFDSSGRELTADVDYIKYHNSGTQAFDNTIYLPGNVFKSNDKLLGNLPGDVDIYSIKADYVHPLKNKVRVDFGAKASYVKADNAANYFNIYNGNEIPDYDKTNRFLYDENINAAYINFRKEYNRWGIQLGFRAENTIAKGHQLGNATHEDSSFTRNYTDIFPTSYFSYKLDSIGNNSLSLSYGRRIERPAYNDLNPFLFFRDKFSYRVGNPFLKPQYSHNVELGYKYKSIFGVTFMYAATTGEIRETVEQNGNVFISRTSNVGKNYATGIRVNASYDITRQWRCTFYGQDIYRSYKANLYNAEYLNTSMNTWGASLYNELRFTHGWSAELYGMYIGDNLLGQFTREPLWQIDAGIQKRVIKDKGSLRLSATDM